MKAPVWTWEVPLYFFVGGAAGIAAVIALAASLAGTEVSTVAAARAVAATGALISPLLLVSDLGRPARFLYMLRIVKWTSAMSIGAWTLVLFSGSTLAALGLWWLALDGPVWQNMLLLADLGAAATGLVLATYTGVLLGATVVPVWAAHHRLLPFEFGISSLAAAASLVELVGGFTPSLNRAALAAAAIKTVLWLMLTNRERGTENREPRTQNREPRTANREPRTHNREPRTQNREPRTENREPSFRPDRARAAPRRTRGTTRPRGGRRRRHHRLDRAPVRLAGCRKEAGCEKVGETRDERVPS